MNYIAFLAFQEANVSMSSSKLTCLVNSFSILGSARSFGLSWLIAFLRKFLINLSLLNERSADATVTGSVTKILRTMQTF